MFATEAGSPLTGREGPTGDQEQNPDRRDAYTGVLQDTDDAGVFNRSNLLAAPLADVALVPVLLLEPPPDRQRGEGGDRADDQDDRAEEVEGLMGVDRFRDHGRDFSRRT